MKIPHVQVVTARSHALRLWAIRIVSVALIVSLLANLPAPRPLNLYFADVIPEVRQTVSKYQHQAKLAGLRADVQMARAERYQAQFVVTKALLQSCRDRLAVEAADYDREIIALAIKSAEYYARPVSEVAGVVR